MIIGEFSAVQYPAFLIASAEPGIKGGMGWDNSVVVSGVASAVRFYGLHVRGRPRDSATCASGFVFCNTVVASCRLWLSPHRWWIDGHVHSISNHDRRYAAR